MSRKSSKTPQEKKRESYAKDRRNTYGENAKASRKSIPRKKRRQNRSERRLVNQAIARNVEFDAERIDTAEAKLLKKRKGVWSLKFPDEPLGTVVAGKIRRRVKAGEITPAAARGKLRRVRRLTKAKADRRA
jgi:hypothetical protein